MEWAGVQPIPLQMKETDAPERSLAVMIHPRSPDSQPVVPHRLLPSLMGSLLGCCGGGVRGRGRQESCHSRTLTVCLELERKSASPSSVAGGTDSPIHHPPSHPPGVVLYLAPFPSTFCTARPGGWWGWTLAACHASSPALVCLLSPRGPVPPFLQGRA